MTDPKGGFFTLLTESATGGKYTGPVHWDVSLLRHSTVALLCADPQQRRTFTVAERKRIQGVPDKYDLHGSVAEVSPTEQNDHGQS